MQCTFVSVDVEASGPAPPRYSMLALGACIVGSKAPGFYAEFQPISYEVIPEAMAVHGLSLHALKSSGEEPSAALERFRSWLTPLSSPTFVGLNAAFDWGFVNAYFTMFGDGTNPFGFAPLDIKAFAMGALRVPWCEARSSILASRMGVSLRNSHRALHDAEDQAKLFEALLNFTSQEQ